jgi:hypothetical protein
LGNQVHENAHYRLQSINCVQTGVNGRGTMAEATAKKMAALACRHLP